MCDGATRHVSALRAAEPWRVLTHYKQIPTWNFAQQKSYLIAKYGDLSLGQPRHL